MKCLSGLFARITFGKTLPKFKCQIELDENLGKERKTGNNTEIKHNWKDLFRYVETKEKYLLWIGAVLVVVSGIKVVPNFYINKGMFTSAFLWSKQTLLNTTNDPKLDLTLVETIYPYAVIAVARGIFFSFTTFCAFACWELAAISLHQKMKNAFLEKILHQELTWITDNKNQLMHKLNTDIRLVQNAFNSTPLIISDIVLCWASSLIIFAAYSPLMVIIFIILEIWCLSINSLMNKIIQANMKEKKENEVESAQTISEIITNLRTVVAFGGEKNGFGRFLKLDRKRNIFNYNRAICTSILASFLNATAIAQFTVVLYMTTKLYCENDLPFALIQTITLQLVYIRWIKNAVPLFDRLKRGLEAGYAILNIIDSPVKMKQNEGVSLCDFNGGITIENLGFRYPNSSKEIFHDFNLKIEPGEVVAFVGKSGSGKSTIFNLLTRFYDPTSGQIKLDGVPINTINKSWLRENVGIVSQEPVLFDATIEENIKFGRSGATFEEVEKADGLANATEFIRNLPKGYDTNALELSGGQKQRVAIARALIRNPKVLLLDEATSALDSESEKLVKDALNLAFKGRTVLIVAHKLSTIVHADRIYVLSEGKIVQSGSYDKLLSLSGEFNELFNATADEEEFVDRSNLGSVGHQNLVTSIPQSEEIDAALKSLKKSNYWLIALGMIAACLMLLIPLDALLFSFSRSRLFPMFNAPLDYFLKEADYMIKLVLIVTIVSTVIIITSVLLYSYVTEKLTSRLTLEAFWSSFSFDLTDFKPIETMNTMMSCPEKIREAVGWSTCSELCILTTSVIVTFIVSWQMALLLIVTIAFTQICFPLKMYILKNFDVSELDNGDNVAVECLHKIKTVQLLSLQNYMTYKYTNIPKERYRRMLFKTALYCIEASIAALTSGIASAMVFLVGSYFYEKKHITFAALQNSHFMAAVVSAHSILLVTHLKNVGTGIGARKSLIEIKKQGRILKTDTTATHLSSIEGSIEFQNVSFAYKTNPNHRILKNVNLHILPGQTVGIVGKSGSGKSTLISLIEKFIEPTSGQILIDGVNIADYRTDHLRSRIGIVSQEPVLFNCSIRENIAYGVASHVKVASDEDIYSAAKAVGVHQFIMNLPMGYETPAGECGSLLSGGQKQRVAVARAFIRKPNIVILDEATSALDNRTEKSVRESLETLCLNRTTLIIAHRLSTIKNADFIIVLDDGQIVEKGTYEELIEIGGYFYDLVQKSKIQ